MRCPDCNAVVKLGQKTCQRCGCSLTESKGNSVYTKKKNPLTTLSIVFVVIAVLSFAIARVVESHGSNRFSSSYPSSTYRPSKTTTSTPRPTVKPSPTSSATMGEQNALKSAKAYLALGSGFSRQGLIDQLKFEGFTDSEAEYAVKNCGADWKQEAVKCAAAYLDLDFGFSKSKLIEQLEYEGFTHDQAVYGVEQNGY